MSWEQKFKYDVDYVEKQSLLLDIKILWMTFVNVISRKDISADGHATMEEFKGWFMVYRIVKPSNNFPHSTF